MSTPLSVVAFKWKPLSGYRSIFRADAVNALRRMVAKHYPKPHRFICCTDDPSGIDKGIEIVPLWDEFANIPSPHGGRNPSCYRRLRAFRPDIAALFGERFVWIDLDTVIVGDLVPIFDRPEDFVIWGETDPRSFYNGSMVLMTAGSRRRVYDEFDPKTSPRRAKQAGKFGSDQGWVSYCLGKGEATWGRQDGVYSYRVHIAPQGDRLPEDARVVMFHGKHDPWSWYGQRIPWVREHWGEAA
jgi:hypothetical protein